MNHDEHEDMLNAITRASIRLNLFREFLDIHGSIRPRGVPRSSCKFYCSCPTGQRGGDPDHHCDRYKEART